MLGQVSVSYGATAEFSAIGHIIPEEAIPELVPGLVNNAFSQDDLYVVMTFLKMLETLRLEVPITLTEVEFANLVFLVLSQQANQ